MRRTIDGQLLAQPTVYREEKEGRRRPFFAFSSAHWLPSQRMTEKHELAHARRHADD